MVIDDYENQVALWRASMTPCERKQATLDAVEAEAAFVADQTNMSDEMKAQSVEKHDAFMDALEDMVVQQFQPPVQYVASNKGGS